jgi:RNA polymerase sigma-70 factor (ECF subfamily)
VSAGPPSLVRPFVDAAPAALRAALEGVVDLPRRLWALVADGRAAWPDVHVEPRALVAFVAGHLDASDASPGEVEAALDGLRGGDLTLACACAAGDPAALAAFDRHYMKEVDIALARMRVGPPRSHDVKQLVRQRLFVGPPVSGGGHGPGHGPGKITEYAGRGDLRRWVRAVAVRTCLNDLRKGKHEVLADDDLIAQQAMPGDDPELAYMKRTYAGAFKDAFTEALAGLGPREQTLLRYHHVDSLNIDEIGAIYRVHRVTAFRWLEKARAQLVDDTLVRLRGRLQLSAGELESVLRLIRSQVHLSLVRQLGGPADRAEDDVIELDASDVDADVDDTSGDDGDDAEERPDGR